MREGEGKARAESEKQALEAGEGVRGPLRIMTMQGMPSRQEFVQSDTRPARPCIYMAYMRTAVRGLGYFEINLNFCDIVVCILRRALFNTMV